MKYIDEVVKKFELTIQSQEIPEGKKIHQLRVTTKRLRALWRLLRRKAGEETYNEENLRLRGLAKQFGKRRDEEVILKLAHKFKNKTRVAKSVKDFDLVEKKLGRPSDRGSVDPQWPALRDEVKSSAARLDTVKLQNHWLKKQIKKSLKQTEKQLAKCLRVNPHPEDFHRWRRRTKNLMYQIEFLKSEGIEVNKNALRNLKNLADDLGDAHDLQVLYGFLKDHKVSRKTLKETLDKQRALEKKSLHDGRRRLALH